MKEPITLEEMKERLINVEANDYWRIVGHEQIPTDEMCLNYDVICENGFISINCAKNRRKVKNCEHCIRFYECLREGHCIIDDK